jgi:DNA mismatch endonuclease (patch repair protein)
MADVMTSAQRSALMGRIRGRRNASTEMRLARMLRAAGVTGWRRHAPLPGRPDFIFRRGKVAVFVDGCFWHGCPAHFAVPKSRVAFWRSKISGNRRRDRRVGAELRRRGWLVIRIWEHALARRTASRALARIRVKLAARRIGAGKQIGSSASR